METNQSNKPFNRFRIWLVVSLFVISLVAQAQLKHLPDNNNIPSHPRILLLAGEEQQIKANIVAEPAWAKVHQSIIEECDSLMALPLCERIIVGRRLRTESGRIFSLSYAYRMTGQAKYAERAEKEMLALAAFVDWNPTHFLCVSGVTMAMAIGYDWLYNQLSPASREIIKSAILKKGIDPSLKIVEASGEYGAFLKYAYNWNQVCNAGMSFGALAVFEDMPELSKYIIDRAVETIRPSMQVYAPDGVYPEGYGYWNYGTSHNVMLIAAIEKIWKTDFGLSQIPGFLKTASYITNMTGPSGQCFNYSDNGLGGSMLPTMFWFADKINDKSLLWGLHAYMKTNMVERSWLSMLWGSGTRLADVKPPAETVWVGKGKNPVALMRTSWTDPKAIYVGLKGGFARAGHGHMDVGSFIMEADGVRWASDFGSENYHALESNEIGMDLWNDRQESKRWQVFRYNNYAHNTLTVNDKLHIAEGYADIVSWSSTPGFMNAISDLTKVFEGQLSHSLRGVAIVNGQYVVVRDEVTTPDKEATVRWTMLTTAEAKITGSNSIELKKDGKKLKIEVAEPSKVTMKTWSTLPSTDYESQNQGTVLVGFEVKVPAGTSTTLAVKLIPQSAKKTLAKIPVLKEWPR